MTLEFQGDLAVLRGFGEHWDPEAKIPASLSPLERLLPDSDPPTASAEAELVRQLVYGEAILFVAVVQAPLGLEAWATWCESDEATARQQTPPGDLGRLARLQLDAPALLVEVLDQIGVTRIHRSMFLRFARRTHVPLTSRFDEQFEGMEDVRTSLVLRNLKLGVWATHIPGFSSRESLVYGTIGVADAVDRFEVDRGRVSTYARSWIKARKSRASANFIEALRDSNFTVEQRMKVRSTVGAIRDRGEEPTTLEILEEVEGLDLRRIVEVYQKRRFGERLAADGVGRASRLLDLCSEEPLLDPLREAELSKMWTLVQEAIRPLPDRQRGIVLARLGLVDGKSRTLSNIGRDFGLSRERIRQLQNAGFEAIARFVSNGSDK